MPYPCTGREFSPAHSPLGSPGQGTEQNRTHGLHDHTHNSCMTQQDMVQQDMVYKITTLPTGRTHWSVAIYCTSWSPTYYRAASTAYIFMHRNYDIDASNRLLLINFTEWQGLRDTWDKSIVWQRGRGLWDVDITNNNTYNCWILAVPQESTRKTDMTLLKVIYLLLPTSYNTMASIWVLTQYWPLHLKYHALSKNGI